MPRFVRILVTGSSGVLGHGFQTVAREYPGAEFRFTSSKDCDLRDPAATRRHIGEFKPDSIVHLAAVSGGVALSRARPATLLRDNVLIALSVMEAARELSVGKLVMTLSVGMYPPDAPLPLKEEYVHLGPAHESNYSYAYAKRLIEPAVKAYRHEYGMNVIGLVPNGIFGEGDKFDDVQATFIAALCRRFWENRNTTLPIVVWGDGSPLRQLTYAPDMARAFMWCMENYDSEQVLNVGTSEEHSIRDIAFIIAEELGINPGRITFDTTKPGGVQRRTMDNSRFLALSSFTFTPFGSGVSNTLNWFRDYYG